MRVTVTFKVNGKDFTKTVNAASQRDAIKVVKANTDKKAYDFRIR